MARIRTIKPEFFRHEDLQDLEANNPGAYVMLVFAGLWGHCDKVGRFEWKPRQLKLDVLPFLDFKMADTLEILCAAGFVQRYEIYGKEYGEIPSFADHQRITGKEAQEPERYPDRDGKYSGNNGETTGKQPVAQEGKGREEEGNGVDAGSPLVPGLDGEVWEKWISYRKSIRKPIKPVSILAAQKELAGYGAMQLAVVDQSIAYGWQGLFELKQSRAGPGLNGHTRADRLAETTRILTGASKNEQPIRTERDITGECRQVA